MILQLNTIRIIRTLIVSLTILIVAIFLFSIIPIFKWFPTGIDAPHHIMWAKSFIENNYPPEFLWKGKNPTPYPLPEIFFAIASIYTGLSLEYLFPIVLIFFIIAVILIIAAITKLLFSFRGWILAIFVALGMKFLLEHIPIGTFAEAYGIFILFLIIYFFIKKKYYLVLFFSFIGFLSHPFVILYLGIIIAAFLPFLILNSRFIDFFKKYKKSIFLIILIIFTTILILKIIGQFSIINKLPFTKYIFSDAFIIKGGHAYGLQEILGKNNFYIFVLLGIIGLIAFLKKQHNFNKLFLAFLAPVFAILVFNHLYNINIEPYRFIVYFQVLIVPLIVCGILTICKKINVKASAISLILFLIILISFNLNNITLTTQAVKNYSKDKKGKLPKEDLKVMLWMKDNIKTANYICSLYKWGHWIPALAQKKVIFGGYEKPFNENTGCALILKSYDINRIISEAKKEKLEYVYFTSYYPINRIFLDEKNYFKFLYKEKQAVIYQINLKNNDK